MTSVTTESGESGAASVVSAGSGSGSAGTDGGEAAPSRAIETGVAKGLAALSERLRLSVAAQRCVYDVCRLPHDLVQIVADYSVLMVIAAVSVGDRQCKVLNAASGQWEAASLPLPSSFTDNFNWNRQPFEAGGALFAPTLKWHYLQWHPDDRSWKPAFGVSTHRGMTVFEDSSMRGTVGTFPLAPPLVPAAGLLTLHQYCDVGRRNGQGYQAFVREVGGATRSVAPPPRRRPQALQGPQDNVLDTGTARELQWRSSAVVDGSANGCPRLCLVGRSGKYGCGRHACVTMADVVGEEWQWSPVNTMKVDEDMDVVGCFRLAPRGAGRATVLAIVQHVTWKPNHFSQSHHKQMYLTRTGLLYHPDDMRWSNVSVDLPAFGSFTAVGDALLLVDACADVFIWPTAEITASKADVPAPNNEIKPKWLALPSLSSVISHLSCCITI